MNAIIGAFTGLSSIWIFAKSGVLQSILFVALMTSIVITLEILKLKKGGNF